MVVFTVSRDSNHRYEFRVQIIIYKITICKVGGYFTIAFSIVLIQHRFCGWVDDKCDGQRSFSI